MADIDLDVITWHHKLVTDVEINDEVLWNEQWVKVLGTIYPDSPGPLDPKILLIIGSGRYLNYFRLTTKVIVKGDTKSISEVIADAESGE